MIDIVKPTIPLTGQEHIGRARPHGPGDSSVVNVPDPTRVTKANDQTVFTDRQPEKWTPNFQSNFDQFLMVLKNTPGLTESYSQLITKLGTLVQSGISEGFASEISSYMQLLNMSEGELLSFLKSQQSASVKFTGPFFDLLRQVVKGPITPDLKGAIVDFLQKYDSMSSSSHVLNNIVANLKSMSAKMPASMSAELNVLIEKLVTVKGTPGTTPAQPSQLIQGGQVSQGANPQEKAPMVLSDVANIKNINTVKSEIIPFLSSYVGRTHDFGAVRDLISMLVLNLSRYETGTEENFTRAFRNLMSYPEIETLIKGIDISELERFFINNKQGNEGNALVDKFVSIISKGMGGEAGSQSRAVFQNVLSSLLINESVYMPLLHVTLPADINGQKFFSEMWIDPNSGEGNSKEEGEEAVKLFIKFDIRDVGFFETTILVQGDKIDMALFYPEKYAHLDRVIKEEIGSIIIKNDLKVQSIAIGKLDKPKTISEVFPKIYEGRNAVNVSV